MRILSLGSQALDGSMRKLGHTVINANPGLTADLQLTHPITTARLLQKLGEFRPEYFYYLDDGNMPLLIDPENMPCPSAYYSIDTYCNPWHAGFAHGFDILLVAQKDFLPIFSDSHPQATWFPLFAPEIPSIPGNMTDKFSERDIPMTFVGTMGHKNNPERAPFLKNFRTMLPLVTLQGDYTRIFPRAKIVLNQTAFAEVNFRCFEAMNCGCALLMEKCENGLLELFTPEETILPLYQRNNAVQAAAIARDWLACPEKLEEIAYNGQQLVKEKHSSLARAKTLENLFSLLPADTAATRLKNSYAKKPFVRSAFGMLAAELTEPRFADHRNFFLNLAR